MSELVVLFPLLLVFPILIYVGIEVYKIIKLDGGDKKK